MLFTRFIGNLVDTKFNIRGIFLLPVTLISHRGNKKYGHWGIETTTVPTKQIATVGKRWYVAAY